MKKRLDILAQETELAASRQRAKALIMAGRVLVNGVPVDKPGTLVDEGAEIRLKGEDIPYVSRGGLKLEKALDAFAIDVRHKVCLDVGASTGGFTDCLLQRGAKQVFAVDVGYGQLAWKLRQDPRVVSIERTNIRHMAPGLLPYPADLATIDVSFISLKIVVPVLRPFLTDNAVILALIKPQFEVGKGQVGKGGIVKRPEQHTEVIDTLCRFFIAKGFSPKEVIASPIAGAKGNREFLICLFKHQ